MSIEQPYGIPQPAEPSLAELNARFRDDVDAGAPWLPKHGGTPGSPQLNAADVMLLRASVNAKISPACLEAVQRLESTPVYAFLGRWGTFRFDVVLPRNRVERRPLQELALEVIALCNEAVAEAITSIVDARHEELVDVWKLRLDRIEEEGTHVARENRRRIEALERLANRPPWYRRAIAPVQRFLRRAKREAWLAWYAERELEP